MTRMNIKILSFMFFCSLWSEIVGFKINEEPATSVHKVEAVVGKVAKLPCDIEPTVPNDRIHIVIWFKEMKNMAEPSFKEKRVPIFSLDARDKPIDQAVEWRDEQILGQRSMFRLKDRPALLILNYLREDDGGVYYCRVDFKQTPTRNIKVNLTVVVPTEKLKIIEGPSDTYNRNYKLGPLNEGSSINITCEATGGRPPPKVTWWLENALLDECMEHITFEPGDTEEAQKIARVRNVLFVEKLDRKTFNSVLTCQASNSRLVQPISSTITLDVNLKPLWVRLRGVNKPMSAGHTYELECEVVGSRPQPAISWWKGSYQMTNTRETTSPDENVTTSVLTFVPTIEDGGKYLSCRGQQPLIPDSGIEDGWKLTIFHVPLVTLELGSTLNGSSIKEGVDVYFECSIKSNPWVYKVSWRHNGKHLYNNVSSGIIVSNQSLVLQFISKARSGIYTCVGYNQEGYGESNSVMLDIKFAPVCRPGQPKVFGLARHEIANITCEVDANPNDLDFIWKFNNSIDIFNISQKQVYSEKDKSVAIFEPITEQDYGILLCWGRNKIGTQGEPCVYHIISAGNPEALSNCSISNQTLDTIYIECAKGSDDGLPQLFILELYEMRHEKLVRNMTSKMPVFVVMGLESGAGFDIILYASNKKGRSPLTHLMAFTLSRTEKSTAFMPVLLQITPLLGILIGVVATLIIIAIAIVIIIRLRGGGERDDKRFTDRGLSSVGRSVTESNSDKASTEPLNKNMNDSIDSIEENNPDIIPQNTTDDEYLEEEKAFERLSNALSLRFYNRIESSSNQAKNGFCRQPKSDSTAFADFPLNKQVPSYTTYNQHNFALNSVIKNPEPTAYAKMDMTSVPFHPGGFQTLDHPHLPTHMYRSLRDGQMILNGSISSETPLLGTSNNTPKARDCLRPPSATSSVPLPMPTTMVAPRF